MRTDPIWVPSEQYSNPSVHKKSSIYDISLVLGGGPAGSGSAPQTPSSCPEPSPNRTQYESLRMLFPSAMAITEQPIFESQRAQKKAQSKD